VTDNRLCRRCAPPTYDDRYSPLFPCYIQTSTIGPGAISEGFKNLLDPGPKRIRGTGRDRTQGWAPNYTVLQRVLRRQRNHMHDFVFVRRVMADSACTVEHVETDAPVGKP
jgi:hypothetical protein